MESEFAPVVLEWTHFLRRTGSHYAGRYSDPVRHEVGTEQFLKPATLQRVGTKRRVEPGGDDGAQLAMR